MLNELAIRPASFIRSGPRLLRIAAVLAGIVLLAFLIHRLGAGSILGLLQQAGWGFFGMVLIFGIQEMLRAFAVIQSLPRDSRPTFKDMLHIRFIGEGIRALTLTGPLLSEPARAWLIRRQGIGSHDAAAATITDLVVHALVSAFLTIPATFYFLVYADTRGPIRIAAWVLLYGSMGLMVVAGFVLWRRLPVIGPIARLLSRLPGLRWLNGSAAGARRTEDAVHAILCDRPVTLITLLLLQFASHALLLLEAYWGIVSMGIPVSVLTASLSEILTKMANVALFAGAAEGAYAVLFGALGLPAAAGFTLSLLKRARSLVVALAGMGSLAVLSMRRADGRA